MNRFGFAAFRMPPQEGQDLGPPPPIYRLDRRRPRRPSFTNPWVSGILLAILALIVIGGAIGLRFYAEYLWYDSLDYTSVFITIIVSQVILFLGVLIFFAIFGGINMYVCRRIAPRSNQTVLIAGRYYNARRWLLIAMAVWTLLFGIAFALLASREWEAFLRYQNAVPFGLTDPIFDQDAAFYVFTLPLWRLIQGWLRNAAVVLSLAVVGFYGFYGFDFSTQSFRFPTTPGVRAHLSVLGAVILATFAFGYWLDQYDLVLSARGVVSGATYADINAQWPALRLLAVVSAISALLLLVNVYRRSLVLPAIGVGAWLVVLILGGLAYPFLIQRLVVQPNELDVETPYIANNIRYTRIAYGLNNIVDQPFPAETSPTSSDIRSSPGTISNLRIWDQGPLKDTYNQVQSIRLYYDFHDIDVDRYSINGQYRQVVLAARELTLDRLPAAARTWINERLQFTHGYGVAMSPVNEVTGEGLPNLWMKDVPPVGVLPIVRPEIYYGETTSHWVVVNTDVAEFDYPLGDDNVYSQYQGDSGIRLDSYFKRLAYSTYFRDMNLLISAQLRPDSQLLFRRQIQERVQALAPFLTLDRDPYIVVADGKLYWVQDAYTTAKRFPYSTMYEKRFNYVRNSVKIVIDAYDGATRFYVVDPTDAVVQTYQAIFPSLFSSVEEAPATVRAHFRYPEDLLQIQANMYLHYHMTDARVFYNKEDAWVFPSQSASDQQPMQPYYVIIRLPGEPREEFLQMLPFTPVGKNNTIAWLAARSDGANYGKLLAYILPKEKLIYGPIQIDARINQDTTISAQRTLWGQTGSRVIFGNLQMIPMGRSFIYLEPLYLQSEAAQLPELKQVIVAAGDRIVMEPTLERALARVFGDTTTPITPITPPTDGTPLPTDVASLVRSAQNHYQRAQDAIRNGDWTTYGAELRALADDLARLKELAGS